MRAELIPLLEDRPAPARDGLMDWHDWLAPHGADEAPFERFAFNHPLYVLYSSGTTGAPKCIVHGAGGTLIQHLKEHQLHCDIRPGDRVVFLSDGIVEARSKSGELYGFKRASAISTEPAGVIAMAAQRFGQEDDITVLSVELRALPNRKSTQGAVTHDCPLPSSSAGISPFGFALK